MGGGGPDQTVRLFPISHKTRTALVVFSIAVGAFAVGVIINSQLVLSSSLAETYEATKPAHANILTLTPFDEQLAKSVRHMEGVEEAEARRHIVVRLKTGPDEWVNLQLLAIADYNNIRVSKVSPDGGAWPPENHVASFQNKAGRRIKGTPARFTLRVKEREKNNFPICRLEVHSGK